MLSACPRLNAVLSFLHCPAESELKSLEDFADDLILQYDGALFIGQQLALLKTVLDSKNFPFISLFDEAENTKNNIYYDRAEACEQAARYLLECGCQNVFLIGLEKNAPAWLFKKSIFRRTFAEAGLWIPDENIINIPIKDEEQCLNALREKLPAAPGKLPDAFFCSTQIISFALLRLANERNWRIPEDFMIMGYANNMQLRPTIPLLTHVRIPYFDVGYKGCEILINNIVNGGKLPKQEIVHADLIIGKTTYKKSGKQVPAVFRQPQICSQQIDQ